MRSGIFKNAKNNSRPDLQEAVPAPAHDALARGLDLDAGDLGLVLAGDAEVALEEAVEHVDVVFSGGEDEAAGVRERDLANFLRVCGEEGPGDLGLVLEEDVLGPEVVEEETVRGGPYKYLLPARTEFY